jgi:hypothetical protein
MTTQTATPPASGTAATPPPAAGGAAPPPAVGGAAPPPAAGGAKPGSFLAEAQPPSGAEVKPGEKPPEGKPAEGAAKLELKLPDSLKADEAFVKSFTELAGTKLGLDSAKAQALVDFYAERTAASEKAGLEAAEAELKSWHAAIVADKDLGGAQLETTKKHAQAALKSFATPGFRQLLEQTGLGSHLEMVRFIAAVGKANADDTVAGGTGGGAADTKTEDQFLKNLFPSMFLGK